MFKHAATALMGVGGVTVPSPPPMSQADPNIATALMVMLQQTAAFQEQMVSQAAADRQANEARDAKMIELLGLSPAVYHDCDDDMHVDLCHDYVKNNALVRNDTSVNNLGVVRNLKNTESNLPVPL